MLKAELEALVKKQKAAIAALEEKIEALELGGVGVEFTEEMSTTDQGRKLPAVDRR